MLGFVHVGMTVSDLDRSIAFYCDLLGMSLETRLSVPMAKVAVVNTGGGLLEMVAPEASAMDRFRDVPLHETGLRQLSFAYDGINELYERLVAAGTTIVQAPRHARIRFYVDKSALVRDPDGMLIEIMERSVDLTDRFEQKMELR